MADPYQLSDAESDLPEPVAALSPAPGGDGDLVLDPHPHCLLLDDVEGALPAGVRVVVLEPPGPVPQPPVEPAVAPRRRRRAASPGDMGRLLQQTFDDLELLHGLPRLQRGQLPIDLYRVMVCLVPPGEEESFLFRYQFVSPLPLRLRLFAMGLSNHMNEMLAEVTDYLWRFWASEDPAGVPVSYHRVHGVGLPTVPSCRGGRSCRSRRPHRASPSAPPQGICSLPGGSDDCECWSCQFS